MIFVLYNVSVGVKFSKPKTIVLPMIANIGGDVAPLGEICTAPIEMFLNEFNSQTKYLPDYNLIAEITDDQCSAISAVEHFIPQFLNWKSTINLSALNLANESHHFLYIPNEINFTTKTIKTANMEATRVPFFTGPLCSAACKAISLYPQFFNLIETSLGCVSPKVDNRKLYANFYRQLHSASEFSSIRIDIAKFMNWTRIAIISDTTQYTYDVNT